MLYTLESGRPGAPAIVFLHGGGLSSKQWQPQFERLSGEFHCLAPDLPEQGRSIDIKPFDLDDAARRVAEVIREHVPGGKAHVVGLSLGGAVTLTLLRLAPEVVNRPMVTGTAAVLSRLLGNLSLASLWMVRLYKQDQLANATIKQQGIPDQYRDLLYDDLLKTATESFTRTTIRALMSMQLPTAYAGPLLVCVGGKETPTARQAAQKLVDVLPNSRGVIAPGLKHVWNLQQPDLFSDTVRAWVMEHPLPAALQPIAQKVR